MKEIDDIHIPFLAWLHERGIPKIYHRPDRKSGIQSGMPDFCVTWMSRCVYIECKTPEGRLSKVQENVHAFLRAAGNKVEVCRSVEECKEAVKNILREPVPGNGTKPIPNFFIGEWQRIPFVWAKAQDGSYKMIRQASVNDIANFPKLL